MPDDILTPDEILATAKDKLANPLRWYDPMLAKDFFYDDRLCIFIDGGNRSGKTTAVLNRASMAATGKESLFTPGALKCIRQPPPIATRIWCEDILRCVREVLVPTLKRWLPPGMLDEKNGVDGFNKETSQLRLTNESFFEMMSYNLPGKKGESSKRDFVIFDELPSQSLFDRQWGRILDSGGRIWISATINEGLTKRDESWLGRRIKRGDKSVFGRYTLDTKTMVMMIAESEGGKRGDDIRRVFNAIESGRVVSAEARDIILYGKGGVLGGVVYKQYDAHANTYEIEGAEPRHFLELVQRGYGDIYAGMDHGADHPTVIVYCYVAKRPVESLNLVEGDYVQIGEYFQRGLKVSQHIPAVLEYHRQLGPKAYFCDPHMWDRDEKVLSGPTVAYMYSEAGIGPLYRGDNSEAGVHEVASMLCPRIGNFTWPRYRLLPRVNPETVDAFESWSNKPDSRERSGLDRYSEAHKDPMDSVRYLVRGHPDRQGEPAPEPVMASEINAYTGVPLNLMQSLVLLDSVLR